MNNESKQKSKKGARKTSSIIQRGRHTEMKEKEEKRKGQWGGVGFTGNWAKVFHGKGNGPATTSKNPISQPGKSLGYLLPGQKERGGQGFGGRKGKKGGGGLGHGRKPRLGGEKGHLCAVTRGGGKNRDPS